MILSKNISIIFNELSCKTNVSCFYVDLILNNIIDNAIKYSNDGSEIIIDLIEKNKTYICKITDFGIGIKKADLDKVFNPFYRSDALLHKDIKGTGLGLSIAEKAARSINATITVTSTESVGTVFTIQF